MVEQKTLATKSDVAKFFGVTTQTVNNWVKEGKLEPIRLSRKCVRFNPDILTTINKEIIKGNGR